jgi:hypothetical protein
MQGGAQLGKSIWGAGEEEAMVVHVKGPAAGRRRGRRAPRSPSEPGGFRRDRAGRRH